MDPAARRTVGELMRRNFVRLAPDDTPGEAERTMRLTRTRALPVLQRDRLLGVAVLRALLRSQLARALGGAEPSVSSLAQLPMGGAGVPPDTSLERAAARLCENGAGFLAVVERSSGEDRVVGVVTESDLLRAAIETHDEPGPPPGRS